MYLKSIKAQGFKSFADKLELEINTGITGIVGPNGSGKSNIVDAVRWVLGEQSVKSLRGTSAMADVIFNGSASREPSKRAMVTLVFDNSDHYLNSDFKEIAIKRVIYITGENEYYLNNTLVRLKDIVNLFINSGTGINAFNIISQGNITNIVNSRPNERRIIFESAAGVLMYKKRKEEALRKLSETEENLTRIKLVINELVETIKPLKKESALAQKYLNLKKELEETDISLIVNDITTINHEYNSLKKEIATLKERIASNKTDKLEDEITKLKAKTLNIEEQINIKREKLLQITKLLAEKNSEKQITLERQKYEVNTENINNNLITLKEEELQLKEKITLIARQNADLDQQLNEENKLSNNIKQKLVTLRDKKEIINNKYLERNKLYYILQNKIAIMENNLLAYSPSPISVKSILNNSGLKGIHNIISKLIKIPDKYNVALDVALGASSNYIIVDDEMCAKDAITYLKKQRLGRATFLPLNIIQSKTIPENILTEIKKTPGFIDIAANLVEYDFIYKNIIENQLGNIIVVTDNNVLNIIGKLINYKYRIVSLDGEILHAGGSITGGAFKKNNLLSDRTMLNKMKDDLNNLQIDLNNFNLDLQNCTKEIVAMEESERNIDKKVNSLNDEIANKKSNLQELNILLKNKQAELVGINDIVYGNLENKLVKLLEEITDYSKEKDIIENDLQNLTKQKQTIFVQLNNLEEEITNTNTSYQEYLNSLQEKEIKAGKMEVKLDNLLINLNQSYSLTYEKALAISTLDINPRIVRNKTISLRKEITDLGEINIGAVKEYERLNKRFTFLNNQKSDLEEASQELKEIIAEMDDIMIDKFRNSFKKISNEFSRIFKLMFKGGEGRLKLNNPDDLLNTGVNIIAIPPGKKVNSPLSLSEGEKVLTAIVLLFAILKVNETPFVILDEVEAALDESNVDTFGKYLHAEKDKCQFIIITHKKKMMEYANILYGITMQESGVSKVVSTKLVNN